MTNLSDAMQDRLDKWRKSTVSVPPDVKPKVRTANLVRKCGKGDYGDALSLEEWEEEAKISQTRR